MHKKITNGQVAALGKVASSNKSRERGYGANGKVFLQDTGSGVSRIKSPVKSMEITIDSAIKEMEGYLEESGRPFSDLETDPFWKERSTRRTYINQARKIYKGIISTNIPNSFHQTKDEHAVRELKVEVMDELLAAAEVERDALDHKAQKEESQITAEIEQGVRHGHLMEAMAAWDGIVKWKMYLAKPNQAHSAGAIKLLLKKIHDHLEAGGYDFDALDRDPESGLSQDEKRKKMLAHVFATASHQNKKGARYAFERLSMPELFESEVHVREVEENLRTHLAAAKADITALDRSGEKGKEQLESELKERVDAAVAYVGSEPS